MLKHLGTFAFLGPTLALPVTSLPVTWRSQPWFTDLSVQPNETEFSGYKPPIVTTFIKDGWLHLPRFKGIELVELDTIQQKNDRRSWGEAMQQNLVFNGELQQVPPQIEAVDAVLQQLSSPLAGAMLVLPCGFGKTVCALYIALQLKRRALILVHTDALAVQWCEKINAFIPDSSVGRLQQNVVDVIGKDFVVGLVQSLEQRDYDKSILATFGTIIIDEAHHMGAPSFLRALQKLPARYILGLSATPDRKDGLGDILPWVMGPIAYRSVRMPERVDVFIYNYIDEKNQVELFTRNGVIKYSEMLNQLTANLNRNRYIVHLINQLLAAGRNIVVLSQRRTQLQTLFDCLIHENVDPTTVGLVFGGTKSCVRKQVFDTARVILSTYSYAAEGIDIPRLDTLVLASPGMNLEQTIGRILRQYPDKPIPMVVDVSDRFSVFAGMSTKRVKFYISQGYLRHFIKYIEEKEQRQVST